jgi:sirohydrochlorin ferrochelatase
MDDGRLPVRWHHRWYQRLCDAAQHLSPTIGGIYVLERGRRSGGKAGDRYAVQYLAQIETGVGAGDDANTTVQRTRSAGSIRDRTANREDAIYQVTGHMADDQVV